MNPTIFREQRHTYERASKKKASGAILHRDDFIELRRFVRMLIGPDGTAVLRPGMTFKPPAIDGVALSEGDAPLGLPRFW